MALKTFLGTDGILRDEDGNVIATNSTARDAIAGEIVPVDIGTRPNANDGDPLRTSFTKLNNFVLASYQNDSDIQSRVGSLEAGAVFLGMFEAGQLPRRSLPSRNNRPWTAANVWPETADIIGSETQNLYTESRAVAVPDLETNIAATDVYAMISRPIAGAPALSAVIDNITDYTAATGVLTIRVLFPSIITDESEPQLATYDAAPVGGGSDITFNAVEASFSLGVAGNGTDSDPDTRTAAGIAQAIQNALSARETAESADYFTYKIEAPTEDSRRLTIDFNFRSGSGADIPQSFVVFTSSVSVVTTYYNTITLASNGNTRSEGINALPWIDQDADHSNRTIPAYTLFQWTRDGWSISDQGRGDINAEYLYFDDERASTSINRTSSDATPSDNPNI